MLISPVSNARLVLFPPPMESSSWMNSSGFRIDVPPQMPMISLLLVVASESLKTTALFDDSHFGVCHSSQKKHDHFLLVFDSGLLTHVIRFECKQVVR